MANKNQPPLDEDELLKSLDAFEASLAKGGDALQNQAHDGGLATEGTNIQSKAEAKKAIALALAKAGHKDPSSILKMLSASDMGSEEDDDNDGEGAEDGGGDDDSPPPPMMKGKKVSKSDSGARALANASSVSSSRLQKALQEDDETAEVINVQPFLKSLVDHLGQSDDALAQGFTRLVKGLTRTQQSNQHFQKSMADGFVLLAKHIHSIQQTVDKMAAQPVSGAQRPSIRKSDIRQPEFHDGDTSSINGEPVASALENVPMLSIQNTLIEMAMKGDVDIMDVTKFENTQNLSILPAKVLKSLENKLCPAAS